MKQLLALLSLLLATACGGSAAPPLPSATSASLPPTLAPQATATAPPPATTVRVIIPDPDNLQYLAFWTALGASYFKEAGLDVQLVTPPNPMGAAQFLITGRGDVVLLQPPQYIQQIAQGQAIVVFANLTQNDPVNLIVRKEVAAQRGLAPSAPLTQRLTALRGLRVGVANGPPTRLRILFASAGMDSDKDIQTVIIAPEGQSAALAEGRVDALYTHTPYLEKALVDQGAVLLVNQSQGEIAELTGLAGHALVTTRQFVATRPEVVLALTRAIYRAQQLIRADQLATAEAVLRAGVPGVERRYLERLLPIYQPAIPTTPALSAEAIQKSNRNFYPATQMPADLSKVNLTDYLAPQFAAQATTP